MCFIIGQVNFLLNVKKIKKYLDIANVFFLLEKKIKLCDGWPDITWLTLRFQK